MLYAVLCYNDEDVVYSWSKEEDAAVMARILSGAAPDPPEMMAPACPMRRPGGAVCPAMNPTTGFFTCCPM